MSPAIPVDPDAQASIRAETMIGQETFRPRLDVAALIPGPVQRVLDVGCGPGLSGDAIRGAGVNEVWGIERDPALAAVAEERLDRVLCSDLDHGALEDLPAGFFDGVIYADVLEHLVDPWSVLGAHRRLVKSDGFIVVSLPNVRHYRVLLELAIAADWAYEPEGIKSIGHLRFFTTRGMRRLISDAGYRIELERANYGPKGAIATRVTFGLVDDFVAVQRLFRARPADIPGTTRPTSAE